MKTEEERAAPRNQKVLIRFYKPGPLSPSTVEVTWIWVFLDVLTKRLELNGCCTIFIFEKI